MAAQRVNPQHVKLHRSYTVADLAARLGVHKNTVRLWQRQGLRPIDTIRPLLFQGATVREFLKTRLADRKRPCGPGTFYCFRCREPRPPARSLVEFLVLNGGRSGNLRALCGTCGTLIHRRALRSTIAAVMPGLAVQIVEGDQRLKERPIPSLDCDFRR